MRVELLAQLARERRDELERGHEALALHVLHRLGDTTAVAGGVLDLGAQHGHDLGQVVQQLRCGGDQRQQLAAERLEGLERRHLGLQAQLLQERQVLSPAAGRAAALGRQLQLALQDRHALVHRLEAVAPLLGRHGRRLGRCRSRVVRVRHLRRSGPVGVTGRDGM